MHLFNIFIYADIFREKNALRVKSVVKLNINALVRRLCDKFFLYLQVSMMKVFFKIIHRSVRVIGTMID